jgi:signal transduction histidine kinase
LPVAITVHGEPRPLPAGIELAVYRIILEDLTNTRKHAGAGSAASVELTYDEAGPHACRLRARKSHPGLLLGDGPEAIA